MKNNQILALIFLLTSVIVNAQVVNIPDPVLRGRLLATNTTTYLHAKDLNGNWLQIDQNNDGEIQVSEALNVSYFRSNSTIGVISTYDGLNSFSNLTEVVLVNNRGSAGLNLSGLIHLKKAHCNGNFLTSIYLAGCTALEELILDHNYISELNLYDLTSLRVVTCEWNSLTSLSLPITSNLTDLSCFSNSALGNIDFNNQINLRNLDCLSNGMTVLNLNNCINLQSLNCSGNNLSELDVSSCTNLNNLICSSNGNLRKININNGFNWNPTVNYFGQNLHWSIIKLCTSSQSVLALKNYYSSYPGATYPSTDFITDCTTLGINENELSQNSPMFYPNPAKEKITFHEPVKEYYVYTLNNVLVKQSKKEVTELNVNDFSSGVYIIKTITDEGTQTSKLIKN